MSAMPCSVRSNRAAYKEVHSLVLLHIWWREERWYTSGYVATAPRLWASQAKQPLQKGAQASLLKHCSSVEWQTAAWALQSSAMQAGMQGV